MIVDAHMHIWNYLHGRIGANTPLIGLTNGRVKIGDTELLGMPATFTDSLALAERFVAEMDAAGVDAGIVVQEHMDGLQNDYCLEAQQKFPGRFFCHGLPDYFQPDSFESQCHKLFDQGFRGIKMCAGHLLNAGIALDADAFMPVWKFMARHGHILAVDLSEGDTQVPQMRRILEQSPDLKVAIGHFGMPTRGGWPAQLDLCRYKNVHIETGGIIWLYRNQGYPFEGALDAICHARDAVGIDKLMWGSDWPRTMVDFTYRQSLSFLQLAGSLNAAEKHAILGDNAARLYNLPAPLVERKPAALITEG